MVGGGSANWGKFSGRLLLRRTKNLKNPAETFLQEFRWRCLFYLFEVVYIQTTTDPKNVNSLPGLFSRDAGSG
jgi:hypothetical protein